MIGPRGNTLKKMETESGAKIAIRGKGSVKEGKGRSDAAHTSNQEEDLHCLIMADTEDKVDKAKKLIHNVIETVHSLSLYAKAMMLIDAQAASIPEGQNELKRNQLRELAALNGTLRDDENQACQNCKFFRYSPIRQHSCVQLLTFDQQAARSGTASTTAPSSATLRPISSAASAATPATWRAIARTASAAPTGATMARPSLAAAQRVASARAMLSTANTRCVYNSSPLKISLLDIHKC